MEPKLAFAAIREGELSATEAWKLLSPLVKSVDGKIAYEMTEALRAWTWKAIDRRRRDSHLREWVDLLNRVEGFFAKRFAALAAKVELLAELLHESVAVAERANPEELLRRKHIASILRWLASRDGEWVERGALMDELGLKPANTTRLMSLLVDVGWAEQIVEGREAGYRIAVEGLALARNLPPERPETRAEMPVRKAGEWNVSLPQRDLLTIHYSHNVPHNALLRQKPWELEPSDIWTIIEDDWLEEEDSACEPAMPPPSPRLVMAGALS